MRVLVACEYSATVRDAFRARGHDAWSCDILPTDGDPSWHIQGDVLLPAYNEPWDLMIAHPPCTHLAVSGARHFAEKRADGRPMGQHQPSRTRSMTLKTHLRRIARRITHKVESERTTRANADATHRALHNEITRLLRQCKPVQMTPLSEIRAQVRTERLR
jgi:hypothetical protein